MQTGNWHCFLEMLLCAFLLVEGRLNHRHNVSGSPYCTRFAVPNGCLLQGIHRHLQASERGEMGDASFEQECLGKVATRAGWGSGVSGHRQQTCHLPTGGGSVSDEMQRSQRIVWTLLVSWRCQVDHRYFWLHIVYEYFKVNYILIWKGRFGAMVCKAELPQAGHRYVSNKHLLDQPVGARKKASVRTWGQDSFHLAVRTWVPKHHGFLPRDILGDT